MAKKSQKIKHNHQIQNDHHSHEAVKRRLQRASGHLQKVIAMINEKEKCIDISMQLHAVVKALIEAKKTIIHEHIEHCLSKEFLQKKDLKEFKEIAKFL